MGIKNWPNPGISQETAGMQSSYTTFYLPLKSLEYSSSLQITEQWVLSSCMSKQQSQGTTNSRQVVFKRNQVRKEL